MGGIRCFKDESVGEVYQRTGKGGKVYLRTNGIVQGGKKRGEVGVWESLGDWVIKSRRTPEWGCFWRKFGKTTAGSANEKKGGDPGPDAEEGKK